MGIQYTEKKLSSFFEEIDKHKITLPNFQRGFVWNQEKQSRLVCSWVVGLPIGSTLLLEGTDDDFAAREICKDRPVTPHQDCSYVLDGQQRLSSLRSVFYNLYKDEGVAVNDSLFKQLQKRWLIRVIPRDGEPDIFGWKNLAFPGLNKLEPSDLIDFIETEKVFKTTGDEKWFHPKYSPKDGEEKELSDNRKRLDIARCALKEERLPLYEVSEGSKGIHKLVLTQFARSRSEELQKDVADGTLTLHDALSMVRPDIDDLDEDSVKEAWYELNATWVNDITSYLEGLLTQPIPIILVPKDEMNRAVSIYEEINEGGTPLSVFDLVVAKSAKGDHSSEGLPKQIITQLSQELALPNNLPDSGVNSWKPSCMNILGDNTPEKLFQDFFLNSLSLLVHTDCREEIPVIEHIKKEKILKLKHDEINTYSALSVKAISRALFFLQNYCGIVTAQDLNYKLMIQPIMYVFRDDTIWNNSAALKKLESWYWVSLFGGTYRERQNEQCIVDLTHLPEWLAGSQPHSTWTVAFHRLFDYEGYSDKDTLLRKPDSEAVPKAVDNGIWQFVLSGKPYDFKATNPPIQLTATGLATAARGSDLSLEKHHVIPLATAARIDESAKSLRDNKNHILNSPLNISPITKEANRSLGALSIDKYMEGFSNYSPSSHFWPSSQYEKQAAESEDEYYERLLASRFESIKQTVIRDIAQHAPDLGG